MPNGSKANTSDPDVELESRNGENSKRSCERTATTEVSLDIRPVSLDLFERKEAPHIVEARFAHDTRLPLRARVRICEQFDERGALVQPARNIGALVIHKHLVGDVFRDDGVRASQRTNSVHVANPTRLAFAKSRGR